MNNEILNIIDNKVEYNEVNQKNIPTFIGGQSFDVDNPNQNIQKLIPKIL